MKLFFRVPHLLFGAIFGADAIGHTPRRQVSDRSAKRGRATGLCLLGIFAAVCSLESWDVAHAAQVTFQWDYSDPRAVGFLLHCGPRAGFYDLRIDVGRSTMATVSGFAAGGTYYCAVTAYSPTQESGSSNEVVVVAPAPPAPNFSISTTSGAAPLDVAFADTSSGQVSHWQWDFGDGAGSTLQNPSHVYTTPGRYTVVLTASGPGGSVSKTATVSVAVSGGSAIISAVRSATAGVIEAPPKTDFTFDGTSGTAPFSVRFSNKTTGATSWKWDFGDGVTSSEQSPTHTYYAPGTYTVVLTASGPGGTVSKSAGTPISVAAAARSAVEADCSTGSPPEMLFGRNALGTADAGVMGTAVAFSTTAIDCGNVGSLSVYLDASSTATRVAVGLYADQAGHPGTLLTQALITSPVAGTWNTVKIPPYRISRNAVYWIAILGSQSGTVAYHTSTGSCAAETSGQTNLSALPSTWTTGAVVGACPVSAFGTSTP